MELWSANRALKVRVDAAAWLRFLSDAELKRLIAGEWGGRGGTAPWHRFYGAHDDEVAILLDYAERADTDVCFTIDRTTATAWIAEHRPALATDSKQGAGGIGFRGR
jgi:hypothetical protein